MRGTIPVKILPPVFSRNYPSGNSSIVPVPKWAIAPTCSVVNSFQSLLCDPLQCAYRLKGLILDTLNIVLHFLIFKYGGSSLQISAWPSTTFFWASLHQGCVLSSLLFCKTADVCGKHHHQWPQL